jgi:hypothetical protein
VRSMVRNLNAQTSFLFTSSHLLNYSVLCHEEALTFALVQLCQPASSALGNLSFSHELSACYLEVLHFGFGLW